MIQTVSSDVLNREAIQLRRQTRERTQLFGYFYKRREEQCWGPMVHAYWWTRDRFSAETERDVRLNPYDRRHRLSWGSYDRMLTTPEKLDRERWIYSAEVYFLSAHWCRPMGKNRYEIEECLFPVLRIEDIDQLSLRYCHWHCWCRALTECLLFKQEARSPPYPFVSHIPFRTIGCRLSSSSVSA